MGLVMGAINGTWKMNRKLKWTNGSKYCIFIDEQFGMAIRQDRVWQVRCCLANYATEVGQCIIALLLSRLAEASDSKASSHHKHRHCA